MSNRLKYLVVYDYGTGGLWAVISADSASEILAKYPALKIVDKRPANMSAEEYESIATKTSFDVNDEPPEWLRMLAKGIK